MPFEPEAPKPAPGIFLSLRRLFARGVRENLWAVLNALDARPALKRRLVIGIPVLVLAAGLGAFGYHRWTRENAIRIARQWLDANRLDRAAIAVQEAIAAEPESPAPWRLASELAWKRGNWEASVGYARKAASVGKDAPDDVLAWGEASILSGDVAQAREAIGALGEQGSRASARALRLSGEIGRREHRFAEARERFQAALGADTAAGAKSLAADEVPLGIVSLETGPAADRAAGQALLSKWAADPLWGAEALRALIGDAEAHLERRAAADWADRLFAHPRCTLGDIPVCLRALADFDAGRFRAALLPLEEKSRGSPVLAAQLVGWLNSVGQPGEALGWVKSLEPSTASKPPVAPAVAESLRATGRWAELAEWTEPGDWGPELGFLEWAYGMVAARHLGDGARADSLWRSLEDEGRRNPAHALVAGESLYAWGYPKESAALLWEAAERQDLAFQALGSLARLYQVQDDAVGQYRAFSRLNEVRPGDRDIANNFAYFAALTDIAGQARVERVARENFNSDPGNETYRSTYAFVLAWTGDAARALSVIEPVSGGWRKSPAVAFAYGAALAGAGRKAEARDVLGSLAPRGLSSREREWIASVLR